MEISITSPLMTHLRIRPPHIKGAAGAMRKTVASTNGDLICDHQEMCRGIFWLETGPVSTGTPPG